MSMAPRAVRLVQDPGQKGEANWGQFAVFRLPWLQDLGSAGVLQDLLRSPTRIFTITTSDFADALGRVAKRVPNGYLFFQHGMLLHRAGRLAEAEAALREAVRTPALIDVKRRGLFELLLVQMKRARQAGEADRKKLHEEAKKELLQLAQWGTYPPWALKELFWIANTLQEHSVALGLSTAWVRQAPGNTEALQARLHNEFMIGANGRAVKTTRELLAKGVDREDMLNQQALAEYLRGNYGPALTHILETHRVNPKNTDLDGNYEALEKKLRLVQARVPILLAKMRLRMALVEARSGNHAAAVSTARAVVPDKEPEGDTRIALACVWGLARGAARQDMKLSPDERDKVGARLEAEALAQLEAAHAAGYFKERPRVECLVEEGDLDSLRQGPGFKQFLAKVGKK
jgi:tetratricopeptide (TPR) repeat protein